MSTSEGSEPFRDRNLELVPTSEAAERLTQLLRSPQAPSAEAAQETYAAICAFVDELKSQRMPPERVLVMMKNVLAAVDGDLESDERRDFVQRVIGLCIKAYYR